MITPDNQSAAAPASKSGDVCVQTDSLAVDGTPPEVGDQVEFKVKGTVSRSEGGNTYVTPTEINGRPAEPDGDEPEADPMADMMEKAEKADQPMGG